MVGLIITRLPAVFAGFVLVCAPLAAQAPTRLEQIPVYAGAIRQPDREEEEMASGTATVATFYRQRTGKQGMEVDEGVMIAVRGSGLFPDLAITIQPNVGTLPAAVKTIVTVRKRR